MTDLLAEVDFTIFIYLIAGVFWLFSSLAQQKKAKRKAAEMRKKREEREREERRTGKKSQPEVWETKKPPSDLDTFLRELTGQPVPQQAPPPPPMPKRKEVVEDIQFDGPTPTPPTPSKSSANPLLESEEVSKKSKSYEIGELDMEASFKQISDIKEAAEMIGADADQEIQQEALANVRSMMIDLSSSSISVPAIPLQSIRAIRTETSRPSLKNRSTFKKSLVASVILEAPKALRENPFKEIT